MCMWPVVRFLIIESTEEKQKNKEMHRDGGARGGGIPESTKSTLEMFVS